MDMLGELLERPPEYKIYSKGTRTIPTASKKEAKR
jgi:hypothetical protein